jgi:F0F1-type ATP synthase delta subunit
LVKRKPTQEELSGIFKNMSKKFKHSITLMAEIKPDLIKIKSFSIISK